MGLGATALRCSRIRERNKFGKGDVSESPRDQGTSGVEGLQSWVLGQTV